MRGGANFDPLVIPAVMRKPGAEGAQSCRRGMPEPAIRLTDALHPCQIVYVGTAGPSTALIAV